MINSSTANYTYVDKANKLILFIIIFSDQVAERERERGNICTKRGVNIH